MTQHVESSQSSDATIHTEHIEGASRGQGEASNVVESVRTRAETCQRLIDDAVEGKITVPAFIQALKDIGLNTAEARDHVEEVTQRIELRKAKSRDQGHVSHEPSPEAENRNDNTGESHAQAVEAAAWEALQERLEHAVTPKTPSTSITLEQLAELLGEPKKTSGSSAVPQSVLTAVPHLASLQNKLSEDPHISRTWYLRHEYAKDKVVDSLISLGQSQPLQEPISRAMWKLVILDQFVDFDKLYATFDRGYDHSDEPRDFMGGFSLIRKDHASAKKPVRTKYDWMRTFDAWKAAVVLFYPHRKEELAKYRSKIMDFFKTISNGAAVAICFNVDTRDRRATRGAWGVSLVLGRDWWQCARIGIWAFVQMIHVPAGAVTTCVASATVFTKLETSKNVLRNSTHNNNISGQLSAASIKVDEALNCGPRSLKASGTKQSLDSSYVNEPRYRRGFIWDAYRTEAPISPSALDTETALPLPSPPQHLMDNPIYQATLDALKNSIRVETPFNVDKFEKFLWDHPNQPFVQSVMRSLREGFWPFDEGKNWLLDGDDPLENYASEEEDLEAIRAFRDKEMNAGRWSRAENVDDMLPGMKASPLFVVWQKNKARVVTDHSASGINDGIPKIEAKVRYDDMRTFGQAMYNAKRSFLKETLVSWKSDVASAFLNLPAHPLWQIRQVLKVDGIWYIVHRLVFGNRALPRCWCAVSSLMCWIGIKKLNITDLHVFMDDFYSWDRADNLVTYRGISRPRNQTQLLVMWDAIGCPWEEKKQEFGEKLKIIGFWVDINQGTITLTDESVTDIVSKIRRFVDTPSRRPSLREWQRLAGHLNWLLNVLPWGRPALTEMYRKMSGKETMHAGIYLNRDVVIDMKWLMDIIPKSIGVRFLETTHWEVEAADMVVWTDASLRLGLAFVYAGNGFVYQMAPKDSSTKVDIFFLELIAILSAISHVANFDHPPHRLLIFTDSLDSVAVFNTLGAAESMHNAVVRAVSGIILQTGIDLKVCHISGKDNIRADLLSRLLFDEYKRKF